MIWIEISLDRPMALLLSIGRGIEKNKATVNFTFLSLFFFRTMQDFAQRTTWNKAYLMTHLKILATLWKFVAQT